MAREYRAEKLLVLDQQNSLKNIDASRFEAIEPLPLFMQGWATAASKVYGADRVITSTINITSGCPIGSRSLCGQYCFAHRSWDGSAVRENIPEAYLRDARTLKSEGNRVSIFLSTDTEPVPGRGKVSDVTYKLLQNMVEMPPHGLIIHSHTDVLGDDRFRKVLGDLSHSTNVLAAIGFDTDADDLPGTLPGHDTSVKDRVYAFGRMSQTGIKTQASLSPMLGFQDFEGFGKLMSDLGAHRVMVGELRTEFAVGGSEKAKGLDLKLHRPSEKEAISFLEGLGFAGGQNVRDQFYVLLPRN